MKKSSHILSVIGLGYVGLPLAIELSKEFTRLLKCVPQNGPLIEFIKEEITAFSSSFKDKLRLLALG